MNVWPEEETFRLLVTDALMVKPLVTKAIGCKLKEENIDIQIRKRYPKYYRQAKVTVIIFNVLGAAKAQRLEKNVIR